MPSALVLPLRKAPRESGYSALRRFGQAVWALPGTPHEVSLGVAVGMFVAVTPTPGMQMILAAALAGAIGCSARAAMLMTFVSNPLTGIPLNVAAYVLGRPFVPSAPALSWSELSGTFIEAGSSWTGFLSLGERILFPVAIGSIVLGLILGTASYALTRLAWRTR